jgi:hypothetical protein
MLLCLVTLAPALAGPAAQPCVPGGVLARKGDKPPKRACPSGVRAPGMAASGQRRSTEVPLPRKVPAAPDDDNSLELSDGLSLTGRLGPRDQAGPGGPDNVATKRTAIVPRGAEESPGNVLKHGASDGLSLGLSFDFETK